MRAIKMYKPPGEAAPLSGFLLSLDGKLRDKLLWQIYRLANIPLCDVKESHFKHFSVERYSRFYELREKNRILVRLIFTIDGGDIILLAPFIKHQPRDTMRALDQSLKMLADIRASPKYAADFILPTKEDRP